MALWGSLRDARLGGAPGIDFLSGTRILIITVVGGEETYNYLTSTGRLITAFRPTEGLTQALADGEWDVHDAELEDP